MAGQSSAFKEFRAGTENYEKGSKDYAEWWKDPGALEIVSSWDEIQTFTEEYAKRREECKFLVYCAICSAQTFIRFPPIFGKRYYCQKHLRVYGNKKPK